MPADSLRAVARHQPDNQGAGDWNQHDPSAQVVVGRRCQRGAPSLEEEQIGKQPDQLKQPQRHERQAARQGQRQGVPDAAGAGAS